MTPWMMGTVAAESVFEGVKKIGFFRVLILVLVLYLMSLLNSYVASDLKAEEAVKTQVVPVLQDIDQRMRAQTDRLEAIERWQRMNLNLQVEQCVSAAELADRSTRNCTAIAGGNTPWVK